MMPFLPFGNPCGYRFQGAFGNSIQMSRISLFIFGYKILSDFLHQADIKSLNSAKYLNNLIPVSNPISIENSRMAKGVGFEPLQSDMPGDFG